MYGWVELVLVIFVFVSYWLFVVNNDLICGDMSNDWNIVLMFLKSFCCLG